MVARTTHLSDRTGHSAISRAIGGLLLVFVIYGTTIEAAHRHGRILSSEQSTTSSFSTNDTGDNSSAFLSCAECPICQLQQHFSASLVTVRGSDAVAVTASEVVGFISPAIKSRSTTSSSGRAPPFTS